LKFGALSATQPKVAVFETEAGVEARLGQLQKDFILGVRLSVRSLVGGVICVSLVFC
jgi:hypothetical protein